jgi:hypothetical protein
LRVLPETQGYLAKQHLAAAMAFWLCQPAGPARKAASDGLRGLDKHITRAGIGMIWVRESREEWFPQTQHFYGI